MKFCFFGNISGALKGKTQGGAELQIALLAKALALKGHEVVIIDPYSNESFVTNEGVKLINVPEWNKGIKVFRLFWNRLPALKRIFLEQKADYYYGRMRTYFHFLSYKASRRLKTKFILGIAHDVDVLSIREKVKYQYSDNFNFFNYFTLDLINDLVFHYLIKRADYITIQHSGQVMPHATRGKVVLFPNIFDDSNLPVIKNPSREFYIHVGTLTIIKGIRNLYQLAGILDKSCTLVIVGDAGDKKSRSILEKFYKNQNVVFKGWLSHSETMRLIANAKALINTSNYEGFPNIFLEAWATGVPVISLNINPGNVFDQYHLGVCCHGDLDKMKKYIESGDVSKLNTEELTGYVSKFHGFATAADRFLHLLN